MVGSWKPAAVSNETRPSCKSVCCDWCNLQKPKRPVKTQVKLKHWHRHATLRFTWPTAARNVRPLIKQTQWSDKFNLRSLNLPAVEQNSTIYFSTLEQHLSAGDNQWRDVKCEKCQVWTKAATRTSPRIQTPSSHELSRTSMHVCVSNGAGGIFSLWSSLPSGLALLIT